MAATLIRHATINTFKDLALRDVRADLTEVLAASDVAGLQEVNTNDHKTAVNALVKAGWGVYWPGGAPKSKPDGANQIPIVWRTSLFTVVTTGREMMHDSGGGNGPSRWISWVVLKVKKTGELVVRMNTHMVHQAWTSHPERKPLWNAHEKKMIARANALVKEYGPVVGAGDFNRSAHPFSNYKMVYPNQGTFGSTGKYDYFFIAGTRLATSSPRVIGINSDHDAFVVSVAAIPVKEATPSQATPETLPAPLPVVEDNKKTPALPYRRVPPVSGRWRYLAMSLNGNGGIGDEILDLDLPLSNVTITENLSGHNSLSATIAPKNRRLLAPDGEPLIKPYESALIAENDGEIWGMGILKRSTFDDAEWQVEAVGFSSYPEKQPWVSSDAGNYLGVEVDPLDVVRVIWDHLQSKPHGNIGLEIPDLKAGYTIGVELAQVEFDTQSGPLSFESGPVQLNWYSTSDLGQKLQELSESTPFDWRERHFWDGDQIRHVLDIGYPTLTRRRDDLRFVVGENVDPVPTVENDGEDYATEILVLGAGDGRQMIRGNGYREPRGLRRALPVTDSSLRTKIAANKRGAAEAAWRNNLDEVSSFFVRNVKNTPLGSYQVGDEVYLESRAGWRPIDTWLRIVSISMSPDETQGAMITCARPDRIES